MEEEKEKFDEVGIEMPEPIYRIKLVEKTEMASKENSPPKPVPKATEPMAADVSKDLAIEKQIANEERTDTEPDLLD